MRCCSSCPSSPVPGVWLADGRAAPAAFVSVQGDIKGSHVNLFAFWAPGHRTPSDGLSKQFLIPCSRMCSAPERCSRQLFSATQPEIRADRSEEHTSELQSLR